MTQVYKWGWDQRSKLFKRLKQEGKDASFDESQISVEGCLLSGDGQNLHDKLKGYIKTNTDEFGGYSKPKWHQTNEELKFCEEDDSKSLKISLECLEDESLCKLVGIDIDQKVQELLQTIKQQDQL